MLDHPEGFAPDAAVRDIIEGLSRTPRALPGRYLWDAAGSALFDRICATGDYYLTRAETAVLARAAPDVAALVGPGASLVEYGAGASRKVRLLLDALASPQTYLPVDISADFLRAAAGRLAADYPGLAVRPLVADYTLPLALPQDLAPPRLGFFPGSTIGNFPATGVRAFLVRARETLAGGRLLIGHDPNRDAARLLRAYGDADGLMPALHLNLLAHLNRLVGPAFAAGDYRHDARIERDPFRVEAALVARRPTAVRLAGRSFEIAAGERIHTDSSFKMTAEGFLALAAEAGWHPEAAWHDPGGLCALHLLTPAPPTGG